MADVGQTPPKAFVHLHVHSAYSLLEGALPLAKLIDLAGEYAQPAVAVTDRNNLFGALEFSEKAAGKGLQPIIGCLLDVDFQDVGDGEGGGQSRGSPSDKRHAPLVLLASNSTGYDNLTILVSKAYLETGAPDTAHILLEDLISHADGLICLSGGPEGPINTALETGQANLALERFSALKSAFDDRFYVELQRQRGYDKQIERRLIDLAYTHDVPLVATNAAYFPGEDDFEAHDALICIAEGRMIVEDDRRRLTPDHAFRSTDDMLALFADLPEATENTIEIARRCAFKVPKRPPILPSFAGSDVADEDEAVKAEADALRQQAIDGLKARLDFHGLAEGVSREDYEQRLEHELNIIESMRYPGYFLIVADFIKWAKERGIPVGPGRGSGAGSLVAWALTITDLDPLRFSLLFERFLNPERVSMPDFDIDFCQDRRDEVIRYVQDKYGREQVAQIITFGTLQARAVMRDVGRVLQMPYGQVDRLCKLVPNNPANPTPLHKAIETEAGLQAAREEEQIVDTMLSMAVRLEGLYRHASTHAAGIVIGDRPLDQLVPLYRDPRSDMPVTQYNMKWVEQAGLVKFDFLGLKTLTVLQTAVDLLKQRGIEVDLAEVPLDDVNTFEMLQRGETVGVFQLESQGMRKALIGMKPDQFEDIIALVALYRPGPMDNIPTYNARKHGEEEPDFLHPKIERVLKETHGVIIYQEQVMEIAQILSGYSLGEADLLRRAMGKKIRSEMDAQRVRFVDGAVEGGLDKSQANLIFDLLAKFADYGFNKSHAAAYALVSYHTAWLKANYPIEFLAASMTLDLGNTDKLSDFYREAKRAEIELVPPSVNTSHVRFAVNDGKVFYALAAIKGVGEQAVSHIIEEREANGTYTSLTDFFSRIDPKFLNRRSLENLICAGAFDCFGAPREQVLGGLDRLIGHAARLADEAAMGQGALFGGEPTESNVSLPLIEAWMPTERLYREFQAIGFYLSAHPLDEYGQVLEKMRVQSWADFQRSVKAGNSHGKLAGTISTKQERKTRTGNRMAIVQASDSTGQFEAVAFSETLAQNRERLEAGKSVIMLVSAEDRPEGINVRIQSVSLLEDEAGKVQSGLRIYVRDPEPVKSIANHLNRRGSGAVSLVVIEGDGDREIEVALNEGRYVTPEIASAVRAIPGVVEAELV
ncbi:MAG: DNA polymerase III subunit alpha [Pseudomonadota bacterium]